MTAREGWDKPESPPRYVPLVERIQGIIDRAVARRKAANRRAEPPVSREDKRARAQALREQADALERQP